MPYSTTEGCAQPTRRPRLDSGWERLKQYDVLTTDLPQATASPGCNAVDLRKLSWTAKLAQDYSHAYDRLDPFFAGSPTAAETWQRAIAHRRNTTRTPGIADVVAHQLSERGAPAQALASASRLNDPEAVAIVTGQQAGLFGGPLFTLLKALTAIKIAQQVSSDRGVETVPVFWVDGEDHDLEEVSSCGVLTVEFEHRSVSLSYASSTAQPASAVMLTPAVDEAIAEMRRLVPQTEFSDELFDGLSAAYSPGVGLVEAFSRWLDRVLGSQGLVVFDASDAAAKPLAQSIFSRELEILGHTSRLAAAAGDELSRRGYHAQVTPTRDAVALFYLDRDRKPIRSREGETGVCEIGADTQDVDELRRQAEHEPAMFSPSVLLRPVIQDALFPTVAYIAGPSELAYLGQLRGIYEYFDIPMPVIYPRASATLVDRATLKFLTRYDLAFEQLQAQDDGTLNRLLASLLPEFIDRTLSEADDAVATRLAAIAKEVSLVDPTLVGAVKTTQGKMARDLRNLRGKIVQAAKRRDETLRRQFDRARNQCFPLGTPQERSVGFVYFLNKYGPHLVERLLADLPLELGQHWLMTV